ncbi:MAG: Asp-tRNA(Asn)/Glu-tRNA(Gln) amidotransferase subunit GatC [Ferruginibacter sp.]|nr:Asp-tRNA(Asn)/Glu-tRNA(Gln) amidotransferase subunit GatC [Ferruginibacter sp.]
MEINNEIIDKLAGLARLRFDDNEKVQIKTDMQNMIGFIEKMNEINTDNVAPLLHMSTTNNITRVDMVQGSIGNEDALKNAQNKMPPYFVVPTVIKK